MTGRPLIVAVVLLRRDGAALLHHRDNRPDIPAPGLWVFPGGHADPGETSVDCALRELEEETAYRAPRLDFLLSFEDDFFGQQPVRPMDVFWGIYDGHQPVECREGQGLRFVLREEALGLQTPPYQMAIWYFAMSKKAFINGRNE
jgi:8-oxo-dGTP pyrophosphatase MutT (NUDIX family)